MPRHPPIALKTLDRSHCQCPSRNPGGIVARTRSCAEPGFNGIGTKRPASRDPSGGAVRQPIICGRLSVSPRQTRAIDAQPAECRNNRGPHSSQGVRTNLLFTMSCRTCGGPKPAAKPDTNDVLARAFLSTPLQKKVGGAGRDRTDDPLLAKQVLSQLSYGP